MKCKDGKIRETEITMAATMQPFQANVAGNVHGGEIMKFMDNVAGAAAIQYTKSNVVTARVDELQFIKPIHVGGFVTCTGKIVYVGNTSLEVLVTVDVENLITHDEKQRALTAYFTMVALDENGNPAPIPAAFPETEKEIELYEEVEERRKAYRNRKKK